MSQLSVPWKTTRGPKLGGSAALIANLAIRVYGVAAPLVQRFAGLIFCAALVAGVLAVWAHYGAFMLITDIARSVQNDPELVSAFGLPLTVAEIDRGLVSANMPLVGLLKYLLWPLQSELVRDLLCLGGVFALFNLVPIYCIWWERKVAGHIQSRMGPMRVGGWHGWAQSFADGVKLITKEDMVPDGADKPLFRLAPYLAMVPALLAFLCLPLGTYWVFREMDVALLFILAMLGVEVVGVIMAGWASNNKWSVYGAMREACQMVSYEIPMTTVLLVPIISAGTLSLVVIGQQQSGGWHTWVAFSSPFAFLGFVTYYIASLASCKRAPFDLPESESELVAGFHTEYSGFRWALFFFAEYAAMFVVSGLAVTLFLGAWYSPLPMSWAPQGDGILAAGLRGLLWSGPLWYMFKCLLFIFVQMWIRWTLPRIRIDQVLYSCVQVMFPIAIVALLGHAFWVLMPVESIVYRVSNIIFSLIGALTVLVCLAIVLSGYRARRRLVGYLAVDALPGS